MKSLLFAILLIAIPPTTQANTDLTGIWSSENFTCGVPGYIPQQIPSPPKIYVTYKSDGKFSLETDIPIEEALGCKTRYGGTYTVEDSTLTLATQSYSVDITCLQASEVDSNTINKIESDASKKIGETEVLDFIVHEGLLYVDEDRPAFSDFVCKKKGKKIYLSFQKDR